MEPKTKIQKQVVALSGKLPAINEETIRWAYDNHLKSLYYISRKQVICLECNHKFKSDAANACAEELASAPYGKRSALLDKFVKLDCPACGAHLELVEFGKRSVTTQREYFTVYTTCEGFQVVRVFQIVKSSRRKIKLQPDCFEIIQYWISPRGKIVSLARLFSGMGFVRYWTKSSALEVRTYTPDFDYGNVHPEQQLLPEIIRNGWNGEDFGFYPHAVWAKLLSDPMAETLLKAKQFSLFKALMTKERDFTAVWPAIRILLRNGVKVTEKQCLTWLDYIEQLIYLEGDIRNFSVIWPKDLHAAHNKLTAKATHLKRLVGLHKAEEEYQKKKSPFFGLKVESGELQVHVIESVHEFKEHGDLLKHCVFVNEYYKKPNSLILSAKVSGAIVEAVEVSLDRIEIVQARGLMNQPTQHNARIIALVKQILPEIRKRQKRQTA